MLLSACFSEPSSLSSSTSIRKDVEWRGTKLDDLNGDLHINVSPIEDGRSTQVHLGVASAASIYLWDHDHVRMPFSPENVCEMYDDRLKKKVLHNRWDMAGKALRRRPLSCAQDLQEMILEYNLRDRWNFDGLADYLGKIKGEERRRLFRKTLPEMTKMCLSLDSLITQPIPMLRSGEDRSLTFSQQQIASLLANAFFCTFPRRNAVGKGTEYETYPDINFSSLFAGNDHSGCRDKPRYLDIRGGDKPRYLDVSGGKGVGGERQSKGFFSTFGSRGLGDSLDGIKEEKLKCIFNYFRRRAEESEDHDTLVTFHRRCLSSQQLPKWAESNRLLPTKFHVSSGGLIEDDGAAMLQVDFANSLVGGCVLSDGSVQEQIKFLSCPELILARLFTERLQDNECLVVTGFERYNAHRGYASTFAYDGDYDDDTEIDELSQHRKTRMVAMDARRFRSREEQFTRENVMRELNKAYLGFYNDDEGDDSLAVATGNWGCGIFGGDPHLKSLIQLMAAAEAGRDLAYFTFGDKYLRDEIYGIYGYLKECDVSVGTLFGLICDYGEHIMSYRDGGLHSFLRKHVKPIETHF